MAAARAQLLLARRAPRRAQQRRQHALARLVRAVEQQVVEHGEPRQAARDLEGAHQARRGDLVGPQPAMSRPSSKMRPPSGGTTPVMQLNSVVLPAPFGPISPVMRPASTSRSTPRRARTP